MNKVVFLDRDGVINDGTLYYTYKISDFKCNEGVFVGLKMLIENGFKLIVISNQSGVAKGEYTIENVEEVHDFMKQELRKNGIELTDVFYCPHHPDVSNCECRKPGTLLFEQAIEKHAVDVTKSYMIGDSKRDIEAANKMNIKGILISKNENIVPYCKQIIANS
jgi:D-glycero-D-manno-heptose 1,7-bisphosphate phosphatase